MTKLLRAATRACACARARVLGLACALHYRTFGDRTDLLIEVDTTEGVNCAIACEAVGGPYPCMCTVVPEVDDPERFWNQAD